MTCLGKKMGRGSYTNSNGRNDELAAIEVVEDLEHPGFILSSLNRLRMRSLFTDAILCVGQEEILCHKAVLAASSPYFEAMFSAPYREQQDSRVVIEHISPWTMKRLLELVYTGRVEVSVSNVQDLLAAGRLLEYPSLVAACVTFMRRRLDVANCLGVEMLADLYGLEELREAARTFAIDNFTKVTQDSSEWNQLPLSWVEEYLQCNDVDVKSEEDVLTACLKWIAYDPETRMPHLASLLASVRLAHVSREFIQLQLTGSQLFQESPSCCALLQEELTMRLAAVALADSISTTEPSAAKNSNDSAQSDDDEEEPDNDEDSSEHPLPSSADVLTTCRPPRPSTVKRDMMMVVGGLNSYILNCTEIYHPGKEVWFPGAPIPASLTWFSATVLNNNIYLTGGIQDGRIMSSLYIYTSLTGAWTSGDPMPTPRARHASVAVGGQLFLFGGVTVVHEPTTGSVIQLVGAIHRYDPLSNSWTLAGHADMPRKESVILQVDESGGGGRVIGERTLIEVGGVSDEDSPTTLQMAIYRVRADLTVLATSDYIQLPKPIRHARCLTRLQGTLLYILCEDSGTLAVLNLPRNSIHFLASLPDPRLHCAMTVCQDKIFVVGGFRDVHSSVPCPTVNSYDPRTNTWTSLDSTPSMARGVLACLSLKM